MRRHLTVITLLLVVLAGATRAGEDETAADLRLRIRPHDNLRYAWTVSMDREVKGQEKGKEFTLNSNNTVAMTMLLKGQLARAAGTPVTVRLQDLVLTEKHVMGPDNNLELYVSRGKVKYVENGKVVIDSEKDIGTERLGPYQEKITTAEARELTIVVDPTGRSGEIEGDPSMVEMIRNGGAGIFPLLAGKAVKPGESWSDTISMPKLGEFKLARPAVVRNKVTFRKWELKGQQHLALLDIASTWDKQDLSGENDKSLLVKVTHVDGHSTGTCWFDPATGHFVEGTLDVSVRYRMDGEQQGQTVGMETAITNHITFSAK